MPSITFDTIVDAVGDKITAYNDDLQTALASLDPSDTAGLMVVQRQSQAWSLAVETQATLIKSLGDTLKSLLQKMP